MMIQSLSNLFGNRHRACPSILWRMPLKDYFQADFCQCMPHHCGRGEKHQLRWTISSSLPQDRSNRPLGTRHRRRRDTPCILGACLVQRGGRSPLHMFGTSRMPAWPLPGCILLDSNLFSDCSLIGWTLT